MILLEIIDCCCPQIYLEIPKRGELFGSLQNDHLALGQSCNDNSMDSPVEDSHRTSKEAFVTQLRMVDNDCEDNEHIDQESILQRINSKKEANSYQLGNNCLANGQQEQDHELAMW
ncbi:hypothetical protein SLE2022_007940 [Rubroshorea leprosula]